MRPADCFAPLDAYAARVRAVRAELAAAGVDVGERVLLSSDEGNAKFWADVRGRGWGVIDHAAERTEALHGAWCALPPSLCERCVADGR
jgi:hypothetical protein